MFAWLMLAAFLPALTYFGHWEIPHVGIPGTDLYIGLPGTSPEAAEQGHSHAPATGDHSQHGHGESGGQGASASGPTIVALLAETVMFFGLILVGAVALAAWRPSRVLTIAPPLQPPRLPVLA